MESCVSRASRRRRARSPYKARILTCARMSAANSMGVARAASRCSFAKTHESRPLSPSPRARRLGASRKGRIWREERVSSRTTHDSGCRAARMSAPRATRYSMTGTEPRSHARCSGVPGRVVTLESPERPIATLLSTQGFENHLASSLSLSLSLSLGLERDGRRCRAFVAMCVQLDLSLKQQLHARQPAEDHNATQRVLTILSSFLFKPTRVCVAHRQGSRAARARVV